MLVKSCGTNPKFQYLNPKLFDIWSLVLEIWCFLQFEARLVIRSIRLTCDHFNLFLPFFLVAKLYPALS